jgi:hypothetical protein
LPYSVIARPGSKADISGRERTDIGFKEFYWPSPIFARLWSR